VSDQAEPERVTITVLRSQLDALRSALQAHGGLAITDDDLYSAAAIGVLLVLRPPSEAGSSQADQKSENA